MTLSLVTALATGCARSSGSAFALPFRDAE